MQCVSSVVTPDDYTVTFDSHGGSVVPIEIVTQKELLKEPLPPVKAGYTSLFQHVLNCCPVWPEPLPT